MSAETREDDARSCGAIYPDETHANLQALIWLGRFDDARVGLEQVLEVAELEPGETRGGEALALLALTDAKQGNLEHAVQRWDEAVTRMREHRPRWAIRALIDAAETLLDRDGPADISAAAARLAAARALLAGLSGDVNTNASVVLHEASEDKPLRLRVRMLLDRARGATSDAEGATLALSTLIASMRGNPLLADVTWRAHAGLARLYAHRGAEAQAQRANEHAMELLEDAATALPKQLRDGFWSDPQRALVRTSLRGGARRPSPTGSDPARDARWVRLVEITKRLASEHDVERLLERITESAVDLSGAERGFVLVTNEEGALSPRAVRDAAHPDDPHIAFSRSIAEAVLIDGEPLVTVDARSDGRVSDFLSVHNLMLQSVACLPIRDASGTRGVLYVEHRVRKGRFGPSDVELLLALADQAAIALANATTFAKLEAQAERLQKLNEELAAAHESIEKLLDARTSELDETRRELTRTREAMRSTYDRQGIVGRSEVMRKVLSVIDRVRDTSVPIVIHGESGTGKELVARATHFGSERSRRAFVALNCAAVPENLLESELFGHRKGSFTGADRDRPGVFVQASGGTLFLDEIGDMPAKMQVELLRVLQDGKVRAIGSDEDVSVDVRIVSASNKQLKDLVQRGLFREDLFYRLNVVELSLPALRQRREDIPLLAEHFLARIAKKDDTPLKRLTRDALRRLSDHPLPGNVRQLEHVLVNACVMTDKDTIDAADLTLLGPMNHEFTADESEAPSPPSTSTPENTEAPPGNEEEWKALEKRKILDALEACAWNRVKAAQQLDMPRRTFYRRLKEYGILE